MTQSLNSARKFSIRFTVGSMFIFATVITATIAISLQYYFSRQMSQEHVLTKLTMASSEISEYIQQIEVNATSSAQLLRIVSSSANKKFSEREIRDIFIQVLKDNPLFYSLYYGNEREDFYQIINLESSPIVREKINAAERDRWVLIKIRGDIENRVRTTEYLTKDLARTRIESERSSYLPSQRPWYHSAAKDSVYKTEPYLFNHLKITGQTYSTRSKTAVIGVDIVLSSVSSKITADAIGINSAEGVEAFLFNQNGEVLASNQPERTQISTQKGDVVPYPELYKLARNQANHNQMILDAGKESYLYVTSVGGVGKEYFAVVVPKQVITAQVFNRLITSIGITVLVMVIILPIAWVFGSPIIKPITKLREETELIKQRKFSQVQLVDSHIKEVHELSESMLEMVEEIEKHHKEREAFIDAFIYLIAQAIDDKSPYTAGHCNRVPELGITLAEIAEKADSGKFKDFKFNTDDERREFRIAAWLHDCGKITTPDHIVDKGTKLEANYNRIHEIRTRFEVLWRDVEIEYLNALIKKDIPKAEAFERMHQRQSELQQDFEFIANANIGGEFMSNDKVERVKQVAQRTWLRHFDNRLGLSPFEELSKMPVKETLPTEEFLLADKPEHIIHRIRPLEFDPKLRLNIEVPEHQYNQGEIYNLTISRGTLTAEDRFKINEHMISGIKMLEALPFPPELSRVPRYASTHHETLDGKGYPRKLDGSELSVPERILAIADIFEALTAADRPYKKAKPLSIAVDIMHNMALDKHIDYDLFMLFLTSGGFEQYAKEFLPDKQLDKVDLTKYIKAHQPA
ncbi:hypothetical protein L4C38_09110 [Vibrio kasasachensis]|uniref:HD domain-containing phosphohydrolase n=1 Tax=Vibrio kasasachensis TaxID=2910248 RepID=UPI003D0A717C